MATAKIAHANVDTNGEAAGLALINRFDPNHFVKTALQYKSDTDPNTPGDQPGKWAERVLTSNGNAVTIPPATVPWPNSGRAEPDRRLRRGSGSSMTPTREHDHDLDVHERDDVHLVRRADLGRRST